ncbi:Fibrocystin-L [Rhizoclosmatium sp. JEL0117]|nr:Fibrocystin-L [Rhizoclosmatium sp. JEL0117]
MVRGPIILASLIAVATALSLPLDTGIQARAASLSRAIRTASIPTLNNQEADPQLYNQYIGKAIQNHWSEVVVFPRPDTSNVANENNYITIVLHGAKPADVNLTNVPAVSVKGIAAVNAGTLDIHGVTYAPTWTRLAATALKGEKQILIQDIVNWEVGQTILITTTATKDSRDFNQNDVAVIASIGLASGIGPSVSLITLAAPLSFNHYGGPEYQAEVGLLSRRIVVKGDDQNSNLTTTPAVCVGDAQSQVSTWPCGAPQGYGGHIIAIGSAIGRASGLELFQMGQTNVMGRYPYHIHQAGQNGINSYLKSSSIHQSFFRCMSVHGSHNVTISNNVAYDITANCFYIEDGIEEDNTFSFNLAAHIHFLGAPTKSTNFGTQILDTVLQDPLDLIVPTDVSAACFYITNPKNSFIGNAASGGWAGFSFPGMPAPIGLAASITGITPSARPLKQFEGNSAHSTGFWWGNAAGVYIGGLLKTEANGTTSYNPGRVNSVHAETCLTPLATGTSCSVQNYLWMRFNNTKVFLGNKGLMHWGVRVEVVKYEGHDLGTSASVFGQVWIDKMLAICRTNNTLIPYISGCPNTSWWKCALRDTSYWTNFLGFSWYDVNQNHIISNTTFRSCTDKWAPAIYNTNMAVFQFLTHSDQFAPGVMQTTRNIVYQNCNPDKLFKFSVTQRSTVSGRLQSWLDFDGSASLSSGRTLMGSAWANEWWNPYGSPACRLSTNNQSLWLCTNDQIYEASIFLNADPTQTALIGTSQCSNGDLSIACPTIGYAAHLGGKNITNGLAITINTRITGPVVANGAGWFVQYNQGAPVNLIVSAAQFPTEQNYITLVLPYHVGTVFNITAHAATWCTRNQWIPNVCVHPYKQAANLTAFQTIQATGSGDTYYFDNAAGLLYVNIMQLLDSPLGTNNVFNRTQVNPQQFTRAGLTINYQTYNSSLVINAKCTPVNGVFCSLGNSTSPFTPAKLTI